MTITLTREEAQQVLDALDEYRDSTEDFRVANRCISLIETLRARIERSEVAREGPVREWARISRAEPDYRDVVIAGDLWRIEFLPDHAASVVLVRANYEAQPEPEPVAWTVGGLITDFSRDFSAYKTKTYTKPLYTTPPQAEPKPVADKYLMEVECTKCGAKQDGILTVNAPPQREWQGLTDEEIRQLEIMEDEEEERKGWCDPKLLIAWTEAKLKEKNI